MFTMTRRLASDSAEASGFATGQGQLGALGQTLTQGT